VGKLKNLCKSSKTSGKIMRNSLASGREILEEDLLSIKKNFQSKLQQNYFHFAYDSEGKFTVKRTEKLWSF
jgi:hypothetical protein